MNSDVFPQIEGSTGRVRFRTVDLPELGAPIADSHGHLDMLDDPAGALERAAMAGVGFVLTVADLTESPEGTYDGLSGWLDQAAIRLAQWGVEVHPPEVGVAVGVHPHNAKHFYPEMEFLLERLTLDPLTCAVGETGLDFHYNHSPREAQILAFRAHLAAAHTRGLPVIVHLREAYAEGADILREVGIPKAGCVIHCFTGGVEDAQVFLELGCHISFAGPVTFRKSKLMEVAASVPLDRLLVETDCPFLAPEPYRGATNEPALAVLVAAAIAEAKEVGWTEFASAIDANTRRLFCRRD